MAGYWALGDTSPMKPVILEINLDLSSDSLNEIANHYEFLARVCRSRATELDLRAAHHRAAEKQLKSLKNTPAVLDTYLAAGMSFDIATTAAEAATGIPAETYAHYWRKRRNERTADEIRQRAIKVAELTRQGLTDGEIAKRLGLHIKSVSRIRSRNNGKA